VINQSWLDEREMRLDRREAFLDRRENALAINQAWLTERETRLTQGVPDLTQQKEILAFKEAWLDEREMLVEQMEARAAGSFKLAGADSSPVTVGTPIIAETPRTRVEAGRCYAAVVYPAEYKTVAVTKPIEVPKGENLPVLYKTVTEKVKVTDEQMRWTEVLCDTDMSECRVSEIQRALYRGGYNPGPIDGIVGRQTMAAVNAFQKDFNLTVADYLTIETVRALDANY
jgi:lysozyme family protein